MTEYQLKQTCKDIAKKAWGMDFELTVEISARLTRRLGYFRYNTSGNKRTPIKLTIADRLFNGYYNEETILSVIKHELCHWYCFITGKQYDDGSRDFENELKKLGAHSTKVIKSAGEFYTCNCATCGKVVAEKPKKEQVMKFVNGRYTSRCCGSKLIYGGLVTKQDVNTQVKPSDESIAQQLKTVSIPGMAASQPAKQEPKVVITAIKIEDIIQQTKRISNAQMIPAMKTALDENSKEKLAVLKAHYPAIFESSIKYLGKAGQAKLQKLI